MAVRLRSYSKINLGLAIGPPRADGFHSLVTLYQTLALHDVVTVRAQPAAATSIVLRCAHPHVPTDARNTMWKMVARALEAAGVTAEVELTLEKSLPVQGGMGAGSANAAAALLGLERELELGLTEAQRLEVAAAVGSDVPLFLVGGAVLGGDRGQQVAAAPAVTLGGQQQVACVVALPGVGVSTPAAFREWDRLLAGQAEGVQTGPKAQGLPSHPVRDTMEQLSRTYASVFPSEFPGTQPGADSKSGASGIFPEPYLPAEAGSDPENLQGPDRDNLHASRKAATAAEGDEGGIEDDLAENSLLALVRTGMENDFETVVFPQHPSLRAIKRQLMGEPGSKDSAVYAALSGSGSALFGLYRSQAGAQAAQQRLHQHGVQAIVTTTMPRPLYWSSMFAE